MPSWCLLYLKCVTCVLVVVAVLLALSRYGVSPIGPDPASGLYSIETDTLCRQLQVYPLSGDSFTPLTADH